MSSPPTPPSPTYIAVAPPPTDPLIPPSIFWIELSLDQTVEWLWTHLPDGNRVVTGYEIVPKPELDQEVTE